MGQLRPEASVAQVQTLIGGAAAQMETEWPDTHRNGGVRPTLLRAHSEWRGVARVAAVGLGLVGLVLLLACFHVAKLLLARAAERERELGLRTALGAAPFRLIRLVVAEGVVFAALAGTLAILLAWWTQSLVASFAIPIDEPQHGW